MSLREKLQNSVGQPGPNRIHATFGIIGNPYPAASQTSNHPRLRLAIDDEAETRIVAFMRDKNTQVLVVEGTQGVGKTNFLSHFESEIRDALSEEPGYYVVRYLADPEASFDGTIRRLLQEFGVNHFFSLGQELQKNIEIIALARSQDCQAALKKLAADPTEYTASLFLEWLLGFRILKAHKETLGVQFRLDTVESRTMALRDVVFVSASAGRLKGIFLLLDELEKQDGVLGATAVVRYLSAMRAIIDALPKYLFLMIAVTPDAMRRYSAALPAFRSRLQNQLGLAPLASAAEAKRLANFYLEHARENARKEVGSAGGNAILLLESEIEEAYESLRKLSERRGDVGVRQREFLHSLHDSAEKMIQKALGA